MEYTTFLNGYIPHVVGIPSGVLLFILSFYLARTVLAVVFGVVRRRVYLSENLFYLGLLMLSVSLPAAGVWGVTIVFLHHISK